ncbi:MAG: sigma-70 family RNA polymerase sigma factor [Bacteroidales bacterium]|nr:sigma-70 family RNA polymerase sigma factor [Bacteroidales bacterium]
MTEQERHLIIGCKNGNSLCQKQLYLDYGPFVKGICLRYTQDEMEAEDLFHDVFVYILTHIDKLKEFNNLHGWLRTVTINKIIDHFRYKKIRSVESLDDLSTEPSEEPDDVPPIELEQLIHIINQIPERYRTVFNLYVIDKYKQEDIAQMMGETQTNIRTLISRSKSMLRTRIQNYINRTYSK